MPTTMVSTSDTAGLADASSAWSAKGSVTEIYTRIARGLNRCHLGYGKDLATEHLLYGQTPSGSTQALIRIHQRTAENRHGLIAFTYELSEVQGTTYVTAQNKLFDAARTRQLQAGATAWSNGGEVCEPLTVSEIPLPPGVTPAPVRNASAPKP